MKLPWAGSISCKIRWGYYCIVGLVILGLIFTFINLERVRSQVHSLQITSQLLDTILEIRRYEKNWILYGQNVDYSHAHEKIERAFQLVTENRSYYAGYASESFGDRFLAILKTYTGLLEKEFQFNDKTSQHKNLEDIRAEGKKMLSLSENLNETVLSEISGTLHFVGICGIISLTLVAIMAISFGKQLTVSVVNPLKEIVVYTQKIASGEEYSISQSTEMSEIKAVIKALDIMLAKLEHREHLIIQSEKLAAVGTLVAGVAHELNNPLSNVGTSAQILLEEINSPEQVPADFLKSMLEQITEQTDRARAIVRSLLEFSREKEMNMEEIVVSNLVKQTSNFVRGEIPPNVELKVQVLQDGVFLGDKQKLQQTFVNLLINALQALNTYQPASGREKRILFQGTWDGKSQEVRFTIEDNGPGIPDDIKGKIFDPFFTTKDVGSGSGLGLAITQEIVTKHRGRINVDSEENKGTTFIITIPVIQEREMESEYGESKNTGG